MMGVRDTSWSSPSITSAERNLREATHSVASYLFIRLDASNAITFSHDYRPKQWLPDIDAR